MKTLIVGDVHCNWNHLHNLLAREKPDLVLQVGDFGYFPSFARGLPEPMDVPIHWCPGNHEDHKALRKLEAKHGLDKPIEVGENLFYQPRGSIL